VLGLHLLGYLQFTELTAVCEEPGRWSFLCVIAALRLPFGTGSPVNPIAIRGAFHPRRVILGGPPAARVGKGRDRQTGTGRPGAAMGKQRWLAGSPSGLIAVGGVG
jgi:hypothetical protein